MLRLVGALAILVPFIAIGSTGTVGVAEQPPVGMQGTDTRSPVLVGNPQAANRAALFVTLPMTNGFADATDALVETQGLVHDALDASGMVRLVDRLQDSDAVLTVLGRGTGYVELTAALQALDPSVVSSPVMLHASERYIEAMLTVGSCGNAATNATIQNKSPSCYRKIFVGLGDHDVRQGVARAAANSWTTSANALARDVQAWVTQNASRLLALRG
jgi:mRNA-degrading endonuclease toxin of MazEF toxin-antitoxin module